GDGADRAARGGEVSLELGDEPLEELDVLRLLLREAEDGADLVVVAVDRGARVVDVERDDVLLDETEEIEVSEAADLVQDQLLPGRQARDVAHSGERVGKERFGEVERSPGDHVLELPVHAL